MSVAPLATTPAGVPAAPTAAHSSFYAALRILPAEQREAMFQVYDFCRAVDDIADEGGPRAVRLAELAGWRKDLASLYSGRGVAVRLAGLAGPIERFDLVHEDFGAIIDGMVMDAEGDICAPDWATLDLYCDRVASAVGRLSVRIFGVPEEQRRPLAHHLGRALQLTNILRDLDEDAGLGRLYLPREALAAGGIEETDPRCVLQHPAIAAACSEVVARARTHFGEARRTMDACPRATVRSPRLMASVYGSILDDLVAQGFAAPRKRVRVAKTRVLWAILRHGMF
jgi:presqualene diphosphate synthase